MNHAGNLIIIIILIGVFYALMILPQRRQQKKRTQMNQQIAPGAKILTAGGIYAQILQIEDDVLLVRVAPDVEIEIDKRAVMRVVEAPQVHAEVE